MPRAKPYLDKKSVQEMTLETERAADRYPKIAQLYNRLAVAGGKYFYIDPMDSDYWIDRLIDVGEFMYPDRVSFTVVKRCKLEPMMCYQNLLDVYPPNRTQRRVHVYIGYSLMTLEDMWLQHVWMYDGKTIYESTPIKSSKYFGIETSIQEFMEWMNTYRWRLPRDPNWID